MHTIFIDIALWNWWHHSVGNSIIFQMITTFNVLKLSLQKLPAKNHNSSIFHWICCAAVRNASAFIANWSVSKVLTLWCNCFRMLDGNQLTSLPATVFTGLIQLHKLWVEFISVRIVCHHQFDMYWAYDWRWSYTLFTPLKFAFKASVSMRIPVTAHGASYMNNVVTGTF